MTKQLTLDIATEYYNLAGAKLATPQKGLNLVVRTLSDGTIVTEKTIIE